MSWTIGTWRHGKLAELRLDGPKEDKGELVARVLTDASGVHRHDYMTEHGKLVHIRGRAYNTFEDALRA